ncbi:MAG: hypothetical protein QM710_08040 [Flavobacterium sp.]
MKKRLEAELISIAHRILKLKNKSEVDQLYKETQKLYETLAVLKFYQDNYESVKSEVSEDDLEEKLESALKEEPETAAVEEKETEVTEPLAESEPETQEEETEPETVAPVEEAEDIPAEDDFVQPEAIEEVSAALSEEEIAEEAKPAFEPIFELEVEEDSEQPEEIIPAETASEISPEEKPVKLEDFLGDYKDPVFVKPNEVSLFPSDANTTEEVKETKQEEPKAEETQAQPTTAVNPATAKTIAIGLNDRIGFVQHLFNDSNEDFNRVLSQLNTFNTFEEAKDFINNMVIPDYNYWVGEEEYIERFMAIVEKKFQ